MHIWQTTRRTHAVYKVATGFADHSSARGWNPQTDGLMQAYRIATDRLVAKRCCMPICMLAPCKMHFASVCGERLDVTGTCGHVDAGIFFLVGLHARCTIYNKRWAQITFSSNICLSACHCMYCYTLFKIPPHAHAPPSPEVLGPYYPLTLFPRPRPSGT